MLQFVQQCRSMRMSNMNKMKEAAKKDERTQQIEMINFIIVCDCW